MRCLVDFAARVELPGSIFKVKNNREVKNVIITYDTSSNAEKSPAFSVGIEKTPIPDTHSNSPYFWLFQKSCLFKRYKVFKLHSPGAVMDRLPVGADIWSCLFKLSVLYREREREREREGRRGSDIWVFMKLNTCTRHEHPSSQVLTNNHITLPVHYM